MRIIGITMIALLCFMVNVRAQDEQEPMEVLVVSGVITEEGQEERLKGVSVRLYEQNDQVETIVTKGNGKFKFVMYNDKIYTLELSKEGYVTKRVSINTEVPEGWDDVEDFEFDLGIAKATEINVSDETLLEYPSAIIEYDKGRKRFFFDQGYTRDLKKDIEKSVVSEK